MPTPPLNRPFDRFPAIRTGDVNEMRAAIGRYYGDLQFSVAAGSRGFQAHANHCQLNEIGISYASYGVAVHHRYPNFGAGYAITLAAAGAARGKVNSDAVDVSGRRALIASPGTSVELSCGSGYEEITVLLDAHAVERTLASLIGAEVSGRLVFDPLIDFSDPANRLWWKLLRFLTEEVEPGQPDLPLTALREAEQALIVMILKHNRHNLSHVLAGRQPDVALRQVRQAEAYIEAHWDQPITIENLAQLTSVSARSLFHAFRKTRGYSPMAFVKQVRLRQARQMLLTAGPTLTVMSVAYRCGFRNPGNFAREYREAFGELPSRTIGIAQGLSMLNLDGPSDLGVPGNGSP
ncbi:MAG: AraC family transcriptional regulator [Thermomicrobiales bacterium]|nr:AraC family transcriptional regulator [Thermomicrobiales bacterium]